MIISTNTAIMTLIGTITAIICMVLLLDTILDQQNSLIRPVQANVVSSNELTKKEDTSSSSEAAISKTPTLEDLMVPVKLEIFINGTRKTLPDNLNDVAKTTYPRIIQCLRNSPHAGGYNFDQIRFPSDAEEHYIDILNKTKIFRNIYM
jgi:H+/gluconate symporter-like permease